MYIGVRGLYNCIFVPMVNEKDVLFTRDIKKPKTGLQNTWWMDLELGTKKHDKKASSNRKYPVKY